MLADTISNLPRKIFNFFTRETERLGKESKYLRRRSKLTPIAFTKALLSTCFSEHFNLELFCNALKDQKITITKQSVQERFNERLDGLAIMPIVMVAGALGVFAYASSNAVYAHYLGIPFVPNTGELTIFCSAMVGAGLSFLWYNSYPAEVFMGDVGSLALGAALGIVAVLVRQELVLLIMGGLFVIETMSVILQVGYFKYTKGKRLFRMAPLHHHFELKGWAEPKIIVRFWIITVVFVLCGLATLKLR